MNYLLSCELYVVVGHRVVLLVWMWLSAIVPLYLMQVLETSPCRGGAAEIFNFESNTCNLFSFVQPPSAGSNNPASVSPAADHVNPSPQSGPSPLSRGPHQQFPSPQ